MSTTSEMLLPDGVETSFSQIEATMARLAAGERTRVAARSLASAATATVVAVAPGDRLIEAAEALKPHAQTGAVRVILIASGDRPAPTVRVTSSEIALDGLRPIFMNNAIAALRLPSLPAVLWWRGGDPSKAEGAARLADRLVLDAEDPSPLWQRIATLMEVTAVSDLRWTRLTRWRAVMAHFFDTPGVHDAVERFTRLHITGADAHTARLFAGWLATSLKRQPSAIEFEYRRGPAIQSVTFGSEREQLSLRRLPGSQCVEGRARFEGREVSRISGLGDQSLAALVTDELRVRSRDAAFEAAVLAAGAIA